MTSFSHHYQHIIWDWNGTLFDDARVCVEAMNTLLGRRNRPLLTYHRYLEVFDFPVKVYYQRVGFDFREEPFEALAQEYITEYDRRQWGCALQNQAQEALQTVFEHGLTQSILSACHQDRLEQIVDSFEINSYFHRLVGLSDYYAESKIRNGQRLLGELMIPPAEIVLIGDTTHDFEVAQALHIDCILVEGGHHPRERLEATGATVRGSLKELFSL